MATEHQDKVRFKPAYGKTALSRKPVSVLLPHELDEFVRSLPNRTEWLRDAIAEKYQREINSAESLGCGYASPKAFQDEE